MLKKRIIATILSMGMIVGSCALGVNSIITGAKTDYSGLYSQVLSEQNDNKLAAAAAQEAKIEEKNKIEEAAKAEAEAAATTTTTANNSNSSNSSDSSVYSAATSCAQTAQQAEPAYVYTPCQHSWEYHEEHETHYCNVYEFDEATGESVFVGQEPYDICAKYNLCTKCGAREVLW